MLFKKISNYLNINDLDDGTGKCKYLKGTICSIYAQRPNICNTSWVYENYYKKRYSWEEYEELMWGICKKIKAGEYFE